MKSGICHLAHLTSQGPQDPFNLTEDDDDGDNNTGSRERDVMVISCVMGGGEQHRVLRRQAEAERGADPGEVRHDRRGEHGDTGGGESFFVSLFFLISDRSRTTTCSKS